MCLIQMARHTFVIQVVLIDFLMFAYANSNVASNEIKMKQIIETAGCPFVSVDQFLARHVCILPGYQAHEIPTIEDGPAQIVVNLFSAVVLEVKERENRLTLKMSQFLQWFDPRIKLSKHKKPDKMGIVWLSQKNIDRIWHPDLDMYTENLEEWKSLHEPNVYRKLVVLTNPNSKATEKPTTNTESDNFNVNDTENLSSQDTMTQLGGLKAWKATIRCVFDFSSYPFDTQRCKFTQFGNEGMELTCKAAGNRMEWKQKIGGRYVEIADVGSHNNDSIGFDIILERAVEPYLYRYYIPSMAIVFVSQISFIIPLNAVPGRVALVATQFLTLVNIFIHQIADSPGSNLNALGAYILISLLFVIGTTIELAVVLLVQRGKNTNIYRTFRKPKTNGSIEASSEPIRASSSSTTDKIDIVALFLFLSLYVLFNCFYFIRYKK